ncbi:MAG: hypothetical protein R3E96_12280 [Planctomycetota bacterium]
MFARGLHLPAGFELGHGVAYVAQMPNLVALADTDGDDVADKSEVLLRGFGTEDSHHAISAFTWDPAGGFYCQEGTFHHSQVETPWGPLRVHDGAVFRSDPRRSRLSVHTPWGSTTLGARVRWLGPGPDRRCVGWRQLPGRADADAHAV